MDLTRILAGQQGYEIIANQRPIISAQDGADYFRIELAQTAPTLILEGGGEHYAAVASGARKSLDLNKIARLLGLAKLRLVPRGKVKAITGCEIGATPLLGLGLPYILDKRLFDYDFVYGGTGQPNTTLKIAPALLESLNRVIVKFD